MWFYEADVCPTYYLREEDPRRLIPHTYFQVPNSSVPFNNYSSEPVPPTLSPAVTKEVGGGLRSRKKKMLQDY
jgi:hypothetical protein